jgi:Putative redox-active protein (C_GCAxxG_C_C).
MSAIEAKNNYIGVNGKRMNCAQAVLSAFQKKYNIEENLVEAFQNYGGGRAPEGLCGAYYAVKYILSTYDKDKVSDLEKYFVENAGALECSNIKGLKKLSCVGCVEKSSEFLEKLG